MNRGLFLLSFTFLLLFGSIIVNAQTTASPQNFHGKEIQTLVDYLRSLNYTAEADNIEKYLNNSNIIIEPLSGGQHGLNKWPQGPIYVDPGAFNHPRLPWNKSKPSDESAMISLASTLLHEKYHSEHHGFWKRVGSNGGHKLGGDNPMEVEGWNVTMDFLDRAINETLKKANNAQTAAEKEHWLELADQLIGIKLTRITDYKENKYGPELWNATELGELKGNVTDKLKKLQNGEDPSVKSVIDDHNEFERKVKLKAAEYFADFNQKVDAMTNDYGAKLARVPLMVNNKSIETPVKVEVSLSIDNPSDLGTGPYVFQINFHGAGNSVTVQQNESSFHPQYYLTIDSSEVTRIYRSDVPMQTAQELLRRGEITVSSTPPIGRQFEDTCGNGLLDRGEQCDYGYACPERMVCSIMCDCVYPVENPSGNLQPLPPRAPIQPDKNGNYWAIINAYNDNTGKIPAYFQGLLANEAIAIKIAGVNGNVYTYAAVIKNKKLESFSKSESISPTLRISFDEKIIQKIKNSAEPLTAVMAALNDGSIKLEPLTPANQFKILLANFGAKILGILKQGQFNVKPGDSIQITYLGRDATLVGNPYKLQIVIIKNEPVMPVMRSYESYPIGYTNQRSQQLIAQAPQRFSTNAGIYNQQLNNYRAQLARVSQVQLPSYGGAYQPSGVFTTGYSTGARYLTAIGGARR